MNELFFDPLKALLVAPTARRSGLPSTDHRTAHGEMVHVPKTAPLHLASGPFGSTCVSSNLSAATSNRSGATAGPIQ